MPLGGHTAGSTAVACFRSRSSSRFRCRSSAICRLTASALVSKSWTTWEQGATPSSRMAMMLPISANVSPAAWEARMKARRSSALSS